MSDFFLNILDFFISGGRKYQKIDSCEKMSDFFYYSRFILFREEKLIKIRNFKNSEKLVEISLNIF